MNRPPTPAPDPEEGWSTEAVRSELRARAAMHRNIMLRPALVAFGGAMILFGISPLITEAWKYLWALPGSGHAALATIGVIVIVVLNYGRINFSSLRRWSLNAGLGQVIAWACAGTVALIGALFVFIWWIVGAPSATFPQEIPAASIEKILLRAAGAIGGMAVVSALVINYRKQHTTEAQSSREEKQGWSENFHAATQLLNTDSFTDRLSGAYLMSFLVDTAPTPSQAQVAVNVLCGQLRAPVGNSTNEDIRALSIDDKWAFRDKNKKEFELRKIFTRLIREKAHTTTAWQTMDYDFSESILSSFDLRDAIFKGRVALHGAVFLPGSHCFHETSFENNLDLSCIDYSGAELDFFKAQFKKASLNLTHATSQKGYFMASHSEWVDSRLDFSFSRMNICVLDLSEARMTECTITSRYAHIKDSEILILTKTTPGLTLVLDGNRMTSSSFKINTHKPRMIMINETLINSTIWIEGTLAETSELHVDLSGSKDSDATLMNVTMRCTTVVISGTIHDTSIAFISNTMQDSLVLFQSINLNPDSYITFEDIAPKSSGEIRFNRCAGPTPRGLEAVRHLVTDWGSWRPDELP